MSTQLGFDFASRGKSQTALSRDDTARRSALSSELLPGQKQVSAEREGRIYNLENNSKELNSIIREEEFVGLQYQIPDHTDVKINRRGSYEQNQDFSANTIQIPESLEMLTTRQKANAAQFAIRESTPSIGREYRGFASYLFFLLPVGLVLAGLIALAAALLSSKGFSHSFTRLLYPNIIQPAPVGVRIDSPSLSKIQLDSGEQIYLVSAKIFNGSDLLVKNATIEVAAFNDEDRIIAKTRVALGNSLTKAYIKSLSPEIIHQLQSQPNSRQSSAVSIGKDKEFVIAVNDGRQIPVLSGIKSYTVRVSSVVL